MCLDFDLAVQGASLIEVRRKLDEMVNEYVEDALTGEDRDHAEALLSRRAPWRYWILYYWYGLVSHLMKRSSHASRSFTEQLRLALAR